MVRARLASLTLAGGLLLTSSGCFNMSECFQRWRCGSGLGAGSGAVPECTCYDTHGAGTVPTSMEVPASAPVLVAPDPTFTPPPPGVMQGAPPPRIVPVPAQRVPWSPG